MSSNSRSVEEPMQAPPAKPDAAPLASPKRMCLIGATAILVAAIWLQTLGNPAPKAPRLDLATALPMDVAGWRGRDLPLGATEAASRATLESLAFDSYVYREYSRNGRSFSVYAAYWAAGRASVQQTSGHNPDNCWPANGWNLIAAKECVSLGHRLTEGAWRVFATPKGDRVYVQFWLFLDGNSGGRPPPVEIVQSAAWWLGRAIGLSGRYAPEQLFVRISSTEPIEAFENEQGFRLILTELTAVIEKTRDICPTAQPAKPIGT